MNLVKHLPVMVSEACYYLKLKKGGVYFDCTLGSGGHSKFLLENNSQIKIIALDQDLEAIKRCQNQAFFFKKTITFVNDNFVNFPKHLDYLKLEQLDGFLFDLGVSSEQLSDPKRGFSYRQDSLLDMRMNSQSSLTAQEILNTYSFSDLAQIFKEYGEEKKSRQIARKIYQFRQKEKLLTTTQQLVKIVASCFRRKTKKHPARRIFQALRIVVNQELTNLTQGLEQALEKLQVDGRIVVISYHSLEDRIVKQIFQKSQKNGSYQVLTPKPLTASKWEIKANHRARSAKMRVIVRL